MKQDNDILYKYNKDVCITSLSRHDYLIKQRNNKFSSGIYFLRNKIIPSFDFSHRHFADC